MGILSNPDGFQEIDMDFKKWLLNAKKWKTKLYLLRGVSGRWIFKGWIIINNYFSMGWCFYLWMGWLSVPPISLWLMDMVSYVSYPSYINKKIFYNYPKFILVWNFPILILNENKNKRKKFVFQNELCLLWSAII